MSPYHEKYLGIKSIDNKSPSFMCLLYPYVVLKKIINIKHKSLFDELEYFLGKEYSKILCGIQIKAGFTRASGINAAFLEFEAFGFGKTKVIILNKSKTILKNANISLARQYSKSIFDDKINSDYFLAGIYSGILSIYFNDNIEVKETKCYSCGSEECFFETFDEIPNKYKLNEIAAKTVINYQLKDEWPDYLTGLGKKMFQRGNYYSKDGILKVFNVYFVLLKFNFFTFSNYILSRKYKDVCDLYRYLGYIQAKEAANFQKNQFGRSSPDQIFQMLVKELNLFGYGAPAVSKANNKILVKFSKMLLLRQCSQFMEKFEDPYLEGLLLGISSVYPIYVSWIILSESKPDKLYVEMKFGKGENFAKSLAQKIKSKEIKKIVNERMKHKYYLAPS